MAEHHDTSGRRKRTTPCSTGKRVTPQNRDTLWFQKLHEHGPLPSSFLHQYSLDTHKSEKRAKERLTDLFNEDNTPDSGSYLSRPAQQFRTIDSRYNQLVYDLTPASEKALKAAGQWSSVNKTTSGPWLHKFMVSCITASIELATLNRDDIIYIPQTQLLKRAGTSLRYTVNTFDPSAKKEITKDLIPDALFGLEYKTPKGNRFRCFLVEADRSTEPATSKNFNRKSWQRNLLQYEKYIGEKLYRNHLNLKTSLMLLNIVTDQQRAEQIQRLIPKYAENIREQILFQSWEDFGEVFKPPKPNTIFLDDGWKRAGHSDFRIDQV
jgi:Replication-relaxation